MGRDGVAPEQISNINFLNIIDFDSTTGQIHKSRNTSDMQWIVLKRSKDFSASRPASRWNCEKYLLSAG
ncbi:hypothetical protein PPS11_43343 [Pseudomonas putida S11]|nr:hypothetical protein PPS11_43343 [Pseudomonas putida S11]